MRFSCLFSFLIYLCHGHSQALFHVKHFKLSTCFIVFPASFGCPSCSVSVLFGSAFGNYFGDKHRDSAHIPNAVLSAFLSLHSLHFYVTGAPLGGATAQTLFNVDNFVFYRKAYSAFRA